MPEASLNEQLDSAALKNPLVYGMSYVDLLQGRKWQMRPWQEEPYNAVNPYWIEKNPIGRPKSMVLMKPTQVGVSTMMAVKMFHFADYWPVRLMYMLPRQQDYVDFVSTRIDPMISASQRLRKMIGEPNSTRSKKLGNSYLFFMEATVEPRQMPADALFIDEVDLSDPAHIGTAMNRLDDSDWGLTYFLSTPTLPNYGIHGRYLTSDKREWMVKCPHCGHHQVMDWDENINVVGPLDNPDEVSYVCSKCRKALTMEDIKDNGEWVPERPEASKELVGYHISQMMTHPASVLWGHWMDPQQSQTEFYRKRLGTPFEIEGGSVEREDFLITCFNEPYPMEMGSDGESTYFMGVDQGNELQVVIAKIPKGRRSPKVVKVEIVPQSEGFNRIAKLIRLFRVKRAVIDAEPNLHSVRDLQKDFPGKVIMAHYPPRVNKKFKIKKEGSITTQVNIHRTEAFDDLMESVREGYWQLPGDANNIPQDIELLISHMTSLKRDIEERKLQSGIKQVAVWRKLGPDHLAHCMLYLKTAIEVDRGQRYKIVTIGSNNRQDEFEDSEEAVDHDKPHKAIAMEIASMFAEVPQNQITDYMLNKENDEYSLSFPLNVKLQVALDRYGEDDVEWVLRWMSNHPDRILDEIG